MPKICQVRPWKVWRVLVLCLPIAMLTGWLPGFTQSASGEGLAEGTEAYASPDGETPDADFSNRDLSDQDLPSQGLSDQDLPSQDLPSQGLSDQDLPDQDLSDQDLPDQDLSDGDLPSGDL
jgi:uncharacterized protein YjbI with pentapeptide repeats